MIKRVVCFLMVALLSGAALAQHGSEHDQAHNNVKNTASLQRGARNFVNYCMGCHSAEYVRYNRLAEDLDLNEDQLQQNLIFTGAAPFDTMSIAMSAEDATRWFGVAPPDLSLIARSRGTDYLYTFLRGFYADEASATGVNNVVLAGTAMPHVLAGLQGIQEMVVEEDPEHEGESHSTLELAEPGSLTEAEYDEFVRDIVNFLDYIAEPMQLERQALGIRVILFLLVLLLIAGMLKKEIWKDVE